MVYVGQILQRWLWCGPLERRKGETQQELHRQKWTTAEMNFYQNLGFGEICEIFRCFQITGDFSVKSTQNLDPTPGFMN